MTAAEAGGASAGVSPDLAARPETRGRATPPEIEKEPRSGAPERGAEVEAKPGAAGDVWERVRASAPDTHANRALFDSLSLVSFGGGRAVLEVRAPYPVEMASRKVDMFAALFRETAGAPVRVEIVAGGAGSERGQGGAEARRAQAEIDRAVLEHPLVRQTMELFDASVVSVEEDARRGAPGGDAARAGRDADDGEDERDGE